MLQDQLATANARPETASTSAQVQGEIRSSFVNSLAIRWRGYILTAFLLYVIFSFAIEQSDVLATVIASCLGILLLLIFLITQIQGRKIRSSFDISLKEAQSAQSDFCFFSKETSHLIIRTSPVSLMPFFQLEANLCFRNEEPDRSTHILIGRNPKERYLKEHIRFPHRGYWVVDALNLACGDQLGLAGFKWQLDLSKNPFVIPVNPPSLNTDLLPVISSTYKSGDQLAQQTEPRGDYFDIKAYHPSDGARRILWKIFAKKGELVSRQAEKSMDPEGQTLIFSLAEKYQDEVAGAALSYLRRLEKLDINVFFGCLGMGNVEQVATSSASALDLILRSVWKESESFIEEVSCLIKAAAPAYIERIAIFAGIDGVEDSLPLEKAIETAAYLSSKNIVPVLFMVPGDSTPASPANNSMSNPIQNFFFGASRSPKVSPGERFNVFLKNCASNGWEVIILD